MVDGDISDMNQFIGIEERGVPLEFWWIPLEQVQELEVYPVETPQLLQKLDAGMQHFVYKE